MPTFLVCRKASGKNKRKKFKGGVFNNNHQRSTFFQPHRRRQRLLLWYTTLQQLTPFQPIIPRPPKSSLTTESYPPLNHQKRKILLPNVTQTPFLEEDSPKTSHPQIYHSPSHLQATTRPPTTSLKSLNP